MMDDHPTDQVDSVPRPAGVCAERGAAGLDFIAYRLRSSARYAAPAPASRWRVWADGTSNRFANRCLPLLMANQSGWVIGSPTVVEVVWRGGNAISQLEV